MCQKSCFNCIHSRIIGGSFGSYDEPPTPDEAECQLNLSDDVIEQMEAVDYDEDKLPEICGSHSPIMVEKCFNCQTSLNQPEYTWELWADCDEPAPVCGDKCKAEVETKFKAWLNSAGF